MNIDRKDSVFEAFARESSDWETQVSNKMNIHDEIKIHA